MAEEEVAPFDDERFVAIESAHRSSAHPADYPAVILEMDPAPPADFRHPRNPYRERSTNPRNCCIQMGSEIETGSRAIHLFERFDEEKRA